MQSSVTYLFIDAGYAKIAAGKLLLRATINPPRNLAWARIGLPSESTGAVHRTFLYDAPPPKRGADSEDDYDKHLAEFWATISELSKNDAFFCRTGHTKGEGKRARQKAVDIQIAVDMMTHAVRGNMTEAILLSGDLDFEPVVEALVALGTRVTVWGRTFVS